MSTISAGFIHPHSIHPKIQVDVSGHQAKGCSLHLFLRTNDKLFFDPYELEDSWRPSGASLGGHDDITSWDLVPAVPDLERPVKYGYKALKETHNETTVENKLYFELVRRSTSSLQVLVPTHARYQQPDESGYREIRISAVDSRQTNFEKDVDVRALWSCRQEDSSIGQSSICF